MNRGCYSWTVERPERNLQHQSDKFGQTYGQEHDRNRGHSLAHLLGDQFFHANFLYHRRCGESENAMSLSFAFGPKLSDQPADAEKERRPPSIHDDNEEEDLNQFLQSPPDKMHNNGDDDDQSCCVLMCCRVMATLKTRS